MANKKMIPCRVCGKEFEPCSYCQSHGDVFRWRNFACSKECAKEYILKAESYREEQKQKRDSKLVEEIIVHAEKDVTHIMNEPIFEENKLDICPNLFYFEVKSRSRS